MNVLGFIGLLLGLGVLIYLKCVRRMNVLLAAAISVIIILVFNGQPLWESIVNNFANGIGNWITDFLIVFTAGALFGSALRSTGAAQAIGEILTNKIGTKHVGLIIHFLSLLLVFAGVDSIVAMLSIAPISLAMVKKANLPRRFAIACFLGGGCSYVFSFPGSSAINNIMPIDYLNTTTLAAWLPGLIGTIVTIVLILIYQRVLESHFRRKDIGFDLTEEQIAADFGCRDVSKLPPVWIGICALLIVVIASVIFGGLNIITPKAAIAGGLILGTAFNLILGHKYTDHSVDRILEDGAQEGIVCSILTGAMLGFVMVVQSTDSFMAFANWASNIDLPPALSVVFSILMMNIILANSPGSLAIFFNSFSQKILAAGLKEAVIHRISAMASVSFAGMMPHNPGSVVLVETYKTSYIDSLVDIGVICVGCPLIGTLVTVGMISLGMN